MAKKSADKKVPDKTTRNRSPNYPGIGLRSAVEFVGKLIEKDGKAGSLAAIAVKHMGFKGDNGHSRAVLSALKKFNLTVNIGNKIVPTEDAVSIVRFPSHHHRRMEALRRAALNPPIYREIVDFYAERGELPSDDSLRPEIEADWDFNPKAVPMFITAFRDTLTYAGLLDGNRLVLEGVALNTTSDLEDENKPIIGMGGTGSHLSPLLVKVGDLVQWTCAGSDMFDEPRPILALSDDKGFAFVPGTDTGLPVNELTVVNRIMNHFDPKAPTNPFKDALIPSQKMSHEPPIGFKEDTYDLAEGRALFRWPEHLDPASADELAEWVGLIVRKMKRMAGAGAKSTVKSEPMRKFRLLPGSGAHMEKGHVYKAGDIVESADDLVTKFQNKFELVEEDALRTNPV